MVYSVNGRTTPGLFSKLAINAARSVAFRNAQTLGRIQQIQYFGAHAVHRRVATPGRFILTTFLCTLQPSISAIRLIRPLQHSILGLWLTATQAGSAPASHQTISSPHVHRFVHRRCCGLRAKSDRHPSRQPRSYRVVRGLAIRIGNRPAVETGDPRQCSGVENRRKMVDHLRRPRDTTIRRKDCRSSKREAATKFG